MRKIMNKIDPYRDCLPVFARKSSLFWAFRFDAGLFYYVRKPQPPRFDHVQH